MHAASGTESPIVRVQSNPWFNTLVDLVLYLGPRPKTRRVQVMRSRPRRIRSYRANLTEDQAAPKGVKKILRKATGRSATSKCPHKNTVSSSNLGGSDRHPDGEKRGRATSVRQTTCRPHEAVASTTNRREWRFAQGLSVTSTSIWHDLPSGRSRQDLPVSHTSATRRSRVGGTGFASEMGNVMHACTHRTRSLRP